MKSLEIKRNFPVLLIQKLVVIGNYVNSSKIYDVGKKHQFFLEICSLHWELFVVVGTKQFPENVFH